MSDGPPYRDPEWLRQKYHNEQLTLEEVADECGASQSVVHKWMKKHGIERRSVSEAREILFKDASENYRDEEWLRTQYVGEKKSAYKIADECGVSSSTIQHFLEKYDIQTRSRDESATLRNGERKYHDEEWMRVKYVEEGLSTIQMAELCDVDASVVNYWLDKHGIGARSFSEAQANREQSGEDNPAWNGGRPDYYGENWEEMRTAALERDGGECVVCGMSRNEHRDKYGKDIHVHHIQPIATFENPEEANELQNLVTLCYAHHREWEGVPIRPQ